MAAQIPIKNDPVANEAALTKVRNDKLREVKAGHDGTWVAHPGLVDIAMAIFNEHMKGPNQLDKLRLDVNITAKDLLPYNVPGKITEAGIRGNISVGLQYMESWLRGLGCVPINNVRTSRRLAEERTWLDSLNQSTACPLVRGGNAAHGGRRHRRDLALAAVAVAAPRRQDRHQSRRHQGARCLKYHAGYRNGAHHAAGPT